MSLKYVANDEVVCLEGYTLSSVIEQINKMKEGLSLIFNKSKLIEISNSLNNAKEIHKYAINHQKELGIPTILYRRISIINYS